MQKPVPSAPLRDGYLDRLERLAGLRVDAFGLRLLTLIVHLDHYGVVSGNISVLLRKADGAVEQVRAHYETDLAAKTISDDLMYAVRQVVQDCQSALDWTATAVKDSLYPASKWSPCFPLQKDPEKFEEALEKNLKGLRADHPGVAAAIERHQPYQPGKAPLGYLHALRRVNTHKDFTAQTRTEKTRTRIKTKDSEVEYEPEGLSMGSGPTRIEHVEVRGGFAGIEIGPEGIKLGGVPLDPTTGQPVIRPDHGVTEVVYVDWRFADPEVSVLPTLEALASLTRSAVEDVRREAQL